VNHVERAAEASVARGCGFAALGIACALIGFAHDPVALLRAAAVLVTSLAFVLGLQAMRARGRPYKRTEAWLMLDPAMRPPPEIAQRALGVALEDVYHRFARLAGKLALALWAVVLTVRLALWLQP
jgi:cell division protein FtsW (lipid II flippase)